MIELLFALFIVLVLVTVIGHGLWVLAATIVGAMRSRERPSRQCPVCRHELADSVSSCSSCGWSEFPTIAPGNIVRHQLTVLVQRGLLDRATHAKVTSALSQISRPITPPAAPPPPSEIASGVEHEVPRSTTSVASDDDSIIAASLVVQPSPPTTPVPTQPPTETSTSHSTVRERAEQYSERRRSAAVATPVSNAEPPPLPEAPAARRSWHELVETFMEERNMRWGELVGGLLIISCSIALVVSFWAQIAERPLLKFGIFNGVTALLFGVGLHAANKWKLTTTGQGVLIIASLLVPLNFLAIVAFTDTPTERGPVTIAGEMLSVGVFGVLLYYTSRVLAPRFPWSLVLGVIVASLFELAVGRYIGPDTPAWLMYGLGGGAVLCYIAANYPTFQLSYRRTVPDEKQVYVLLKLLGISSFALALTLGLFVFRVSLARPLLQQLSILFTAASIPALATGLFLWRRAELGWARLTGSSVMIAGVLLLLGSIALAWPSPGWLLVASLLCTLLLASLAWEYDIAAGYLAVAVTALVTYVFAGHLGLGRLPWNVSTGATTIQALLSATTGRLLVLYVCAVGVLAWRAHISQRTEVARYFFAVAALATLASLTLVGWHGMGLPGDPEWVTWVFAFYGIATLCVAVAIRHTLATSLGLALLLPACLQGIVYGWNAQGTLSFPWTVGWLVHATLATTFATALHVTRPRRYQPLVSAGNSWGLVSLTATAVTALLSTVAWKSAGSLVIATPYFVWFTAICLAIAATQNWPVLFVVFQTMTTLTVIRGTYAWLASQGWYQQLPTGLWDPWSLQIVGIAVACLGFVWILLRFALTHVQVDYDATPDDAHDDDAHDDDDAPVTISQVFSTVKNLVFSQTVYFDHVAAIVLLVVLANVSIYGVTPGVSQELSTPLKSASTISSAGVAVPHTQRVPPAERFEIPGLPHTHAFGGGAWAWLIVLLLLLVALSWEQPQLWKLVALAALCGVGGLLLACRWEPDVAVASALRWISAAGFAVGSAVIWFRVPLLSQLEQWGWYSTETPVIRFSGAFTLLVTIAVLPLIAMASLVSWNALSESPPPDADASLFRMLLFIFLVVTTVVVSLRWIPQTRVGVDTAEDAEDATNGLRGRPRLGDAVAQYGLFALILTGTPLLVVTLYVVGRALAQHPIVGPAPDSLFYRMGLATSYAAPILMLAMALVGHALRERSEGLAFGAACLFSASATAAYLLSPAAAGPLNLERWLHITELNAMTFALAAIPWAWAHHLRGRASNDLLPDAPAQGTGVLRGRPLGWLPVTHLFPSLVALACAFAILGVLPAIGELFLNPDTARPLESIAGVWGWPMLALVLGALFSKRRVLGTPHAATIRIWGIVMGTALIVLELYRWDQGNWLSYHAMLVALALGPATILGLEYWFSHFASRHNVTRVTSGLTALLVVVSLRANYVDPFGPWWTLGGLLSACLLCAALACWTQRQAFVYAAGILLNLAASIWWTEVGYTILSAGGFVPELEYFLHINLITATLFTPFWVWLDRRFVQPRPITSTPRVRVPFHSFAVVTSLVFWSMLATVMYTGNLLGEAHQFKGWVTLLTGLSVAAGILACLWDARTNYVFTNLHFWGLTVIAAWVSFLRVPFHQLYWTTVMALAAYTVGTSYLWSRRHGVAEFLRTLHVPRRARMRRLPRTCLTFNNLVLVGVVISVGLFCQWTQEKFAFRLGAAQAVVAQCFSVGMVARGRRRSQLRSLALWIGVLGAVGFGWSWLNPQQTVTPLNHLVVVAVALGGMASLYATGLAKILRRENAWTRAGEQTVPAIVGLALTTIGVTLITEVYYYVTIGSVPMAWPAIVAVVAAYLGLTAASLIAAIVPGRDPLGLSEKGRTVYVYAAEAMLTLMFLHIRLTMPWLFQGFFLRYWPLVVMGIAYLGVGLSEWFRRRQQMVLATPLENTGALLPIVPVVGYWVAPGAMHYSLLMLAVGLVYAALSVLRRSFMFGILAALATNGGLWYLLHQSESLGLLQHPQLWLIPPSLCVLAAAYLNRERLDESQRTAIRYLASSAIYTSSAADVFLNGVGEAPWLPMILAAFSLVGIFAGILFHIRSFLFLGLSFLMLALLTVIWYAAVDLQQTWLWYVCGIATGVAIITVFAVFEKKRAEMLAMVEQLKRWRG